MAASAEPQLTAALQPYVLYDPMMSIQCENQCYCCMKAAARCVLRHGDSSHQERPPRRRWPQWKRLDHYFVTAMQNVASQVRNWLSLSQTKVARVVHPFDRSFCCIVGLSEHQAPGRASVAAVLDQVPTLVAGRLGVASDKGAAAPAALPLNRRPALCRCALFLCLATHAVVLLAGFDAMVQRGCLSARDVMRGQGASCATIPGCPFASCAVRGCSRQAPGLLHPHPAVYRLLTSALMHGSLLHLALNMLALCQIGAPPTPMLQHPNRPWPATGADTCTSNQGHPLPSLLTALMRPPNQPQAPLWSARWGPSS